MDNKEFWMAVYLAAVNSGRSEMEARHIANKAVDALDAEWD